MGSEDTLATQALLYRSHFVVSYLIPGAPVGRQARDAAAEASVLDRGQPRHRGQPRPASSRAHPPRVRPLPPPGGASYQDAAPVAAPTLTPPGGCTLQVCRASLQQGRLRRGGRAVRAHDWRGAPHQSPLLRLTEPFYTHQSPSDTSPAAPSPEPLRPHAQVPPSSVILRFLSAQRVRALTTYLRALHECGRAAPEHTTLHLHCLCKVRNGQEWPPLGEDHLT